MEFTIRQIATMLNGKVQGNDALKINQLAKIEEGKAGCISFLSNTKYEQFLYTTEATAVIVGKDFEPKNSYITTLIIVEDAYSAFAQLLEQYAQIIQFSKKGEEQPCFIGENSTIGEDFYRGAFSYIGKNCRIGKNVKIYPQVYIGDNVSIGDNTVIYAGVKIYSDTIIGNNCVFHSGVIIGSDGFGFAPQADGSYKTIPQLGNVIIKDNVNIGANTTIDCATMGSTVLQEGVKLDNLIQVAHNVEIGKHTVIAALTGVAGSAKVGEYCMIGGQVGVAGHTVMANNTKIGAQAGILSSIKKPDTSLIGSPAFDVSDFFKASAVFKKLPQLDKKVFDLEKKLAELTNNNEY